MTDAIIDPIILRGPDGQPTHYVVEASAFEGMLSRLGLSVPSGDEDEEDRRALAHARQEDEGFRLPLEYVSRLVDGEHVIKVLRDFRGIDQGELARRMGTAANYVSQIETGARRGVRKARAFADALDVPVEVVKARL
jgi:DNA-binding transcriptional regulator YiaG